MSDSSFFDGQIMQLRNDRYPDPFVRDEDSEARQGCHGMELYGKPPPLCLMPLKSFRGTLRSGDGIFPSANGEESMMPMPIERDIEPVPVTAVRKRERDASKHRSANSQWMLEDPETVDCAGLRAVCDNIGSEESDHMHYTVPFITT